MTARDQLDILTTYAELGSYRATFEPAFFEAFLLRRLGDPPLNVVVLADAQRLADTWSGIGVHDVAGYVIRSVPKGSSAGTFACTQRAILMGDSPLMMRP